MHFHQQQQQQKKPFWETLLFVPFNLCIEEKSPKYHKDNEVQSCLYVKLKLITVLKRTDQKKHNPR